MKVVLRLGPISIRRQLVFGVALVHVLLMTIFVLDLTEHERSFLTEGAKNRALFQANALATSSLPHVIVEDFGGLSEVVDAFSRNSTIRYAMVTDRDGQVLSHTDHSRLRQHLEDARSLRVLKGPPVSQFLYDSPLTVQVAAPITISGQTIGWAWLGVDRSSDQAYLAHVTRSGLLYTLAALGVGAVFALVLATTITRPLRLLLAGAKRLSQDRLDIPVPVTSRNEVGVVARAFNVAMERLSRQRSELRAAHDELEKRVEARTAELARLYAALQKAHDGLEDRVKERTTELAQMNQALAGENLERRRAEEALKQANASLERSNQDLERFAYVASHDLQEPLRTVKNFTGLLAKRYRGRLEPDADEFIGYVVDGAERMEALIRDLLTFSRAGKSDKELARVSSGDALQSALSNLRSAIEGSSARVTIDPLPEIMANQVEMVQLFQNLVGNAIKYRAERTPEIRVSAEAGAGQWIFSVRDNGVGIRERDRDRIFAVFERVHGKEVPGSGIGLATCSRIIERLGGRIWVDSEIGRGSTFYFAIPAAGVLAEQRALVAGPCA